MPATKRITMTIQKDLVEDLNFISRTLGVSRSGLMCELISPQIEPLKEMLQICLGEEVDSDGTPLIRDPNAIREYLDSLIAAVEQGKQDLQSHGNELLKNMEGLDNEH